MKIFIQFYLQYWIQVVHVVSFRLSVEVASHRCEQSFQKGLVNTLDLESDTLASYWVYQMITSA